MAIDLDALTPGTYVVKSGTAVPKPKGKKRPRRKDGITPFGTTLRIRKLFRSGLSYRKIAKEVRCSLHTVRLALRGDYYITMIAEAEKCEPTLAAVCLVGLSDVPFKNPRAGLDAYYQRGGPQSNANREIERAAKRKARAERRKHLDVT